ncbi:MAG: ABC transporter ATP-binding protein [Candidatus Kariarchaeaceae archaeon]|jgi:oligopeptide transport system ATP-binding protein
MENTELQDSDEFILDIRNLSKFFPVYQSGIFRRNLIGNIKAVDNISIKIKKGEIFGLVGESGCGKTTLGRVILNLIPPTSGEVIFKGENIFEIDSREKELRFRKQAQLIFQDPYLSLNPRMTVAEIVGEPFIIHDRGKSRKERRAQVVKLLNLCGLEDYHALRYAHEFSGGQRQRIGIARALTIEPQLIIADEPVSALDVAVQAQILNLLKDIREQFNLTYIFIAHDLSVVRHISDRIAVMYLGKIVELAPAEEFVSNPRHPYTEALISAIPIPDPVLERKRIILPGDVASPLTPPSGCRFHTRCIYVKDKCSVEEPPLEEISPEHLVACHYPVKPEKALISKTD